METQLNNHGFKVTRTLNINISADKLWEIIGPGFSEAYVWASSVDHSVGKGTSKFEGAPCDERFCDVNAKGFNKIEEKLIKYNDDSMNLAYQITNGMPGFISKAVNNWKVIPANANTSTLEMNADFELQGFMGRFMKPMMKKKMESLLDIILEDAKVYAETGRISEHKRKRIETLKRKNKVAA
ncbi:MAG: SRPBCC family protein [Balneola sp.]